MGAGGEEGWKGGEKGEEGMGGGEEGWRRKGRGGGVGRGRRWKGRRGKGVLEDPSLQLWEAVSLGWSRLHHKPLTVSWSWGFPG